MPGAPIIRQLAFNVYSRYSPVFFDEIGLDILVRGNEIESSTIWIQRLSPHYMLRRPSWRNQRSARDALSSTSWHPTRCQGV